MVTGMRFSFYKSRSGIAGLRARSGDNSAFPFGLARRKFLRREHLKHDERCGHEIKNRTGHPHDSAGDNLVAKGSEARDVRRARIERINQPIGKHEECGEDSVLSVGQQEIGKHRPSRPSRGARPWLDDRVPEHQRGREEACVLDDVPSVGAERELKGCRQMPSPGCSDERDPAYQRLRQPCEESAHDI